MSDNTNPDIDGRFNHLKDQLESMFNDHKNTTASDRASIKREMEDLLADARREHDNAVKEIRESLGGINKWIESEEKSRKQTGEPGSNSSTLVVPPQDVNPPQAAEAPPDTTAHDDEGAIKRSRRWKWY